MANNTKTKGLKNNQQKGHQSCVGHHVLLSSLSPSLFLHVIKAFKARV
jgi:hypothetical protein